MTSLVPVQGAAASSSNSPCNFAVFIGVRGTGAPAGSGAIHSSRAWAAGGMGQQLDSLVAKLKSAPFPVYFESLRYDAAGGTSYASSVSAGYKTLATELNWLATACGASSPAVVLAGHSQGAHVVLDALSNASWPNGVTLTSRAKAMIRAVAVFGDPTYLPSRAYNAPGSPSRLGVFPRNQLLANTLATYNYRGWPQGATSPGTVWKIRSYCLSGDFFCQSSPTTNGMAIHNSYSTRRMSDANSWIQYMLTSSN